MKKKCQTDYQRTEFRATDSLKKEKLLKQEELNLWKQKELWAKLKETKLGLLLGREMFDAVKVDV